MFIATLCQFQTINSRVMHDSRLLISDSYETAKEVIQEFWVPQKFIDDLSKQDYNSRN